MKNKLKILRQKRGLTQQQLADELSVSRQTINSIETEKYDPSLPLAFSLANFLGVKIEDIFRP
jgi:putative transcriptional regulator